MQRQRRGRVAAVDADHRAQGVQRCRRGTRQALARQRPSAQRCQHLVHPGPVAAARRFTSRAVARGRGSCRRRPCSPRGARGSSGSEVSTSSPLRAAPTMTLASTTSLVALRPHSRPASLAEDPSSGSVVHAESIHAMRALRGRRQTWASTAAGTVTSTSRCSASFQKAQPDTLSPAATACARTSAARPGSNDTANFSTGITKSIPQCDGRGTNRVPRRSVRTQRGTFAAFLLVRRWAQPATMRTTRGWSRDCPSG